MIALRVLVFSDCPGREILRGMIPRIEEALSEDLQIEEILIDSPDQAAGYDFHGSPTLIVDGYDLDETKSGLQPVFSCRMYDGRPAPDLKWILDRLQARMK